MLKSTFIGTSVPDGMNVSNVKAVLPTLCALALASTFTLGACSSPDTEESGIDLFGAKDPFDVPITGLTSEQRDLFAEGDGLFDLPLRAGDGLGPLYTRAACSSCHDGGVRGPGIVQKMIAVLPDGVTPSPDQTRFAFGHTVHPLMEAGAKTPIVPPAGELDVKVTTRVGPPILGRGYVEAITDAEIERVAAEQAARTDGIHGRINRVMYASQPNPVTDYHAHQPGDLVIGRFGLKARIATVDDFTADALQGDMGITSPLRPQEFPNPDALTDDLKPGVDVGIASVNTRADYIRLTAIPKRVAGSARAQRLFTDTKCAACHVPAMKTRADYPIAAIAGRDAAIYSDLLLHDMGDTLADGITDGQAGPRDWRTAPLIGLRFNRTFMHDGRAHDVDEAIRAHAGPGSEANESVELYQTLSDADRLLLDEFVGGL
jgi:CxxC motif-containing protein (DUF1111 family)